MATEVNRSQAKTVLWYIVLTVLSILVLFPAWMALVEKPLVGEPRMISTVRGRSAPPRARVRRPGTPARPSG